MSGRKGNQRDVGYLYISGWRWVITVGAGAVTHRGQGRNAGEMGTAGKGRVMCPHRPGADEEAPEGPGGSERGAVAPAIDNDWLIID